MKIINWKNWILILCCTYTIISLVNAVSELIFHKVNDNESLNSLLILGMSAFAIAILALQSVFKDWNIWIVMVVQYLIYIGGAMLFTYLGSLVEPVHPNGYHDMFRSGTCFYLIGAVVYYVSFFLQVRRQNQMLTKIHKMEKQDRGL